ncbi:cupin-like domain-containing protein [Nonomuraea sp. NPDC004702]
MTAVWLASAGSRTPIHRDGGDGLLGQIAGHKRACLAASLSPGDALYIPRGWFHDIDSIDVSASLVLRN